MKDKEMKTFKEMIRDAGLKATPQRISMLETLCEMSCHPNADMLMKALEKKGQDMSVGTIYNILEIFSEKGLIVKLKDNKEVMRFDSKTEFHVHVYDQENNIIDYFDPKLETFLKDYFKNKNDNNYKIKRLDVSILI
jgi:Fe2+ or Zn2+ uptake regulation protein